MCCDIQAWVLIRQLECPPCRSTAAALTFGLPAAGECDPMRLDYIIASRPIAVRRQVPEFQILQFASERVEVYQGSSADAPLLFTTPILRPGPVEAKVIHEKGEISTAAPFIVLRPIPVPKLPEPTV